MRTHFMSAVPSVEVVSGAASVRARFGAGASASEPSSCPMGVHNERCEGSGKDGARHCQVGGRNRSRPQSRGRWRA